AAREARPVPVADSLLALLSNPTIASKHWIIRQYDHEVQGNTVVKPLCGPGGRGPSDASVVAPVAGSSRGIALASGLQTGLGDAASGGDAYQMALGAIDECVRNLVCTGADAARIAILDNFCWPSCEKPANMASLVRACAGCYDGALAYRTPFVSGKDSLNNQLRYTDPTTGEARVIEIPPTLLISGVGIVKNVNRCITMDAKTAGNTLLLVGSTAGKLGGSHLARTTGLCSEDDASIPTVDLTLGPATARAITQLIADGLVVSAHDVSDGGWLTAVAEMLIATTGAKTKGNPSESDSPLAQLLAGGSPVKPMGASISLDPGVLEPHQHAFCESPSRYVLEVRPADLTKIKSVLRDFGAIFTTTLGVLDSSGVLSWPKADLIADVSVLADRWLAPLDW
ncbi:MAG: AIR synthase-related protein, partial [bacterium]|nr:AIR synthase-related protein [bacterium]